MSQRHYNYIYLLWALIGVCFFVKPVSAQTVATAYPRVANFYLASPLNSSNIAELSRYNLVILHMTNQTSFSDQIKKLRQLNPSIKILAYIPSEEFPVTQYLHWESDPNGLWRKLLSGITSDMWLTDETGNHVTFWADNWMLNNTNYPTNNIRWRDYLSSFVVNNILSTGLWDGVFYDNVWSYVSWINNGKIDADRDGRNDSKDALDNAWRDGLSDLFKLTRQKAGKNIIIVGNGDSGYYLDLNGLYMENFTRNRNASWPQQMSLYSLNAKNSQPPAVAIVGNTSPNNQGADSYQTMRFGLGSALMENGYYSYDAGSNSHAENWWYDEYNANLGNPTGASASLSGSAPYAADVWRREYSNGVALVNATADEREIDLGGDYEKIIGAQDKAVNDGSIVNKVILPAKDGIIMYKTYRDINDAIFLNGAFLRFYDVFGQRARNGFFAFENNLPGGAKVYRGDLNNDGQEEKIVITGPKLEIFNNQNEHWYSDFPFGGNFAGSINVAVGRLAAGEPMSLVLAPSRGNELQIYNYYGELTLNKLYPFGKHYKNGFSVAVSSGNANGRVILGTGIGRATEVLTYDYNSNKIISHFFPFEKNYTGGVSLAIGDFYGNGQEEIVVAPGLNKKPLIRVFDASGKKLSEFYVSGVFGNKPVTLTAADVGNVGKKVIVTMSQ